MKRIDWVLENRKEEVKDFKTEEFTAKELITLICCPSEFGLSDKDINSCGKDCTDCWNEEMEEI